MSVVQLLHFFPEDEWKSEIILLEAGPQPDRNKIAGRAGILIVLGVLFGSEAFLNQLVIEPLESRVLNDRQNVDHVGRGLAGANELTILSFDVVKFVTAPHEAQPAPNGLLQQDTGAGRPQRYDHADVVHIEALAQH